MAEPRDLSIKEASNLIRIGELSAMDLLSSCLERIQQREKTVRAWVEIYEEQAIKSAKQCDDAVSAGKSLGKLHGIPVGVKDIIDVKDMRTRAGCEVYPSRIASADAPSVACLRSAGAIILGKTETTAFANNDPAPTRNPWNIRHTPGGSSSGSAAAVADRMCLAALGTQTGGSILRPAAYNGIVGMKPTFGNISLERVVPVSWTLDHVGPHARGVEDLKILYNLLKIDSSESSGHIQARLHKESPVLSEKPIRLGYLKSFCEQKASTTIIAHLESVCRILENSGARIKTLDLSQTLARATAAHRVIMDTELSTYHHDLFNMHSGQYPPKIKARIEQGLSIYGHKYVKAILQRKAFQKELSEAMTSVDAAILPTAPSTAPAGLSSTGSAVFCVPWSFAGFPAITIPSGIDDQGLPFAIQLAARPYFEEGLLEIAAWCEKQLNVTNGSSFWH